MALPPPRLDMSDCCTPKGYRWIFSERMAQSEARRYRRRGLDRTSGRIVDFLKRRGIEGRTVLEIGGGIGAIQIELLKAGAARATSIELTPSYEEVAAQLFAEAGLAERVDRKVMDFAQAADEVESADVVVLNRVLCCYHDMPRLAGAAADHARQTLVMTYPRRALWIRAGLGIGNAMLWLTRRHFHIFVHRPSEIIATSESHGLRSVLNETGLMWTLSALGRAS
ncbi:MAG TPA: methyltransferase domain-containing protein [Candidatus Dormibacteraeota bacterium]|nr:methyltransferase domain-containing protein [Candidatus Dormibacteraeota bacterium]